MNEVILVANVKIVGILMERLKSVIYAKKNLLQLDMAKKEDFVLSVVHMEKAKQIQLQLLEKQLSNN